MSNETSTRQTLSALVTPVDAKITVRKDLTKPYIGLENIPSSGTHLVGWALASSSISTNSVFQIGDVLFGKLRPNLRKCVVAPFDGYCSTDILVLRANEGVDPSFAGKVFRTERVGAAAEKTSVGTKMPRTSWKHLSELEVFCPSFLEQEKVAQILDTLDTAIHETEALIAKLKAVKQGLLYDLLTRGIAANGQLRPPQSEAPQLYKQSPLGWIPKEWDVKPLSQYTCADVTYGIVQAGPNIPGGVPYIRTGDMSGDALVREEMLCTSRRIADQYQRSDVRAGEIVMSIRATVGKVLPVPPELDGANLTQGTARIAPNASTDAQFLLWAIRDRRAQNSIWAEVKGTTFAEISLAALRNVPIAAPVDLDEQLAIGKMLRGYELQELSEQSYREKLCKQKLALMDDLLTGRTRVTSLLES